MVKLDSNNNNNSNNSNNNNNYINNSNHNQLQHLAAPTTWSVPPGSR